MNHLFQLITKSKGEPVIANVSSMPTNFDKRVFVEAMLGEQFMMLHSFGTAQTCVITDESSILFRLETVLPGLKFSIREDKPKLEKEMLVLSVLETSEENNSLDNLYRVLAGFDTELYISFVPISKELVSREKSRVEKEISDKDVGSTNSFGSRSSDYSETNTLHRELYYNSDQKKILLNMLDILNRSMLANGTAYKISVAIDSEDFKAYAYLKSTLLILKERRIKVSSFGELYRMFEKIDAMPFDNVKASGMLSFSGSIPREIYIKSSRTGSEGDLQFGNYMEGSLKESGKQICTRRETMNLGTLISGVPGTGKTFAAMHLIERASKSARIPTIIISPTDEWNSFGEKNGYYLITLYDSSTPINFFKCDSKINIERFYENLAMLLASACDAGPYTKPLEKCLLAAFRKIYSKPGSPEPLEVYKEIEETITERHGKKTHAGVKYTKHGENIKASLENLRQMLARPEFSCQEGVDFESLLSRGVVFDLSKVSNRLKPFFYALILNQAYALADAFDTHGDGELRLILCLEEAQLVLRSEDRSAATADLSQRIQNFRKKGIGLILITHNVTDIEPAIRRLCQTKLYFRQSADVIKYAVADLLFEENEKEALAERLKTLEQRTCALNYIHQNGSERNQAGSVFVKIPKYDEK